MLSAVRGSEKICKLGNGEMGKIVYGRRASQTCRYSLSLLKGCVRYIFASLFCVSKRQHFRNKEKWFLLHFESSFRSWNNQILTFSIFKIMTSSNAQAWNTKHILLSNLESKHNLLMKFGQFMQSHKIIFFIKKFYKICDLETSSRPFLIFKESFVKKILWRSACWSG